MAENNTTVPGEFFCKTHAKSRCLVIYLLFKQVSLKASKTNPRILGTVIPSLRKSMPLISIKSNLTDDNGLIGREGKPQASPILSAASAQWRVYKIWEVGRIRLEYKLLARFFVLEINSLPHRSL
jgi:hypothetical protein